MLRTDPATPFTEVSGNPTMLKAGRPLERVNHRDLRAAIPRLARL